MTIPSLAIAAQLIFSVSTTSRSQGVSKRVVSLLSKQQPEFAPGTQFRYTSSGFAILGRIIEIVSASMPWQLGTV